MKSKIKNQKIQMNVYQIMEDVVKMQHVQTLMEASLVNAILVIMETE